MYNIGYDMLNSATDCYKQIIWEVYRSLIDSADQDTDELQATVTAYALGITIDFPLKQNNACRSLTNAECPLDRYEEVTYKLELDVDKQYPSVSWA